MEISQTLFGDTPPVKPITIDHAGRYAYDPNKDPQENVRGYLLAGVKMSVQDCLRLCRSTEMRRIVSRLRKQGMDIKDRWHGERKYKIYYCDVPPK